jgi:tetratricopeptide (TPR) repeat protein
MRRLDSEQPNLRAVLSWITRDQQPPDPLLQALGDVWVWLVVRGHLRQSSTLWQQIAPLLADQPRTGGDRRARAWLLAYGWMNQGEYAKAIALVDDILPDARRAEKPSRTALLLLVRGMARLYTDRGLARADFGEALEVARALDDRLVLGVALEHYGILLCLDGDPDQATALHQEMLTIARSLDDENLRAEAHYVLAVDALTDGDAGSAAPHLAAAIRHYQNLGHLEGLTRCLATLSALALQHGDPHLAARLIGTATEVRDRFGGSGLRPWPWAAQAEQPTIEQAKALLPDGEYTAQLAAGRDQTIDEALAAATPILQDR